LGITAAVSFEQEHQRRYYAATAQHYDAAHVHGGDEHYFALAFMLGALDFLGVTSVLEVGSGTGRALEYLRDRAPQVLRHGTEPVPELRQIAYGKGIAESELTAGDANQLEFADATFDLVCAFGVLHHVGDHRRVVGEMLRVASKAILISDSNNFGQGRPLVRAAKQALNAMKLWPVANWVKTGGKGYTVTEGDGLSYSYSVFNDYELIRTNCKSVHVINTLGAAINPYRTAPHVALLGIK
jgi:SAM-dependent methyltransferase